MSTTTDTNDTAALAAISVTFSGEAYESFQHGLDAMIGTLPSRRYFVQVTPANDGGGKPGVPFDAWLVGVDFDAEMGDTIRIVRNDDNGATDPDLNNAESVRVDRVHIY